MGLAYKKKAFITLVSCEVSHIYSPRISIDMTKQCARCARHKCAKFDAFTV